MTSWATATIAGRKRWAEGLETLVLSAPSITFEPGQFVNLALGGEVGGNAEDGNRVKRAYSLASAPGAPIEFYLARVPEGEFTPRLFALPLGANLRVDTVPQGFFTISELPAQARELWMIATGTGLGPFVSMWRSGVLLPRFERVVVVHCAREASQLGYREEIESLTVADARLSYVALVTREAPGPGVIGGRVPAALADGRLERAAGLALDLERSHVMLCGNPDMVRDVTSVLGERGLQKHRRRSPGQITTEKYW